MLLSCGFLAYLLLCRAVGAVLYIEPQHMCQAAGRISLYILWGR